MLEPRRVGFVFGGSGPPVPVLPIAPPIIVPVRVRAINSSLTRNCNACVPVPALKEFTVKFPPATVAEALEPLGCVTDSVGTNEP